MAPLAFASAALCLTGLLARVGVAFASDTDTDAGASADAAAAAFSAFVRDFGRPYEAGSQEYEARRRLFESSLEKVERQNSDPNRMWIATVNFLSDKRPDEIKAMTGYAARVSSARGPGSGALFEKSGTDSEWVNWGSHALNLGSHVLRWGRRAVNATLSAFKSNKETFEEAIADDRQGVDTACKPTSDKPLPSDVSYAHLKTSLPENIRNQACANCWAAATGAMMEAHHELHMGEYKQFDDAETTSCTMDYYGCGGGGHCSGSVPGLALEEMLVNGVTESSQATLDRCPKKETTEVVKPGLPPPHEWVNGVRCAEGVGMQSFKGLGFGMYGWERLPENKMEPLMRALYDLGPVAVAVAPSWTNYKQGVYNTCNKDAIITHSVLAIGYGSTPNPTFSLAEESAAASAAPESGKQSLRKRGGKQSLQWALDAGAAPQSVGYWLIQNSWGKGWGDNGLIRLLRRSPDVEMGEEGCGVDDQPQLGTTCNGPVKSVGVCGMCGILYDSVVPYMKSGGSFRHASESPAMQGEPRRLEWGGAQ